MDTNLSQRIQKDLQEKRHNLADWLAAAPPDEKELHTGSPDAQPVEYQLHAIDTALDEIDQSTLGVCDVCKLSVDPGLLDMDYTACVCIDHYTDDERRRLEAELEFSQAVQRALLPQEVPMPSGVELSAFSRPAQIVSGDYFDFLKFRDGADGLAIADAVGHGISAGILMSSVQTALRLLAPDNDTPAAVLERVNRLFLYNHNFTTFVSVFLARYETADRRLCYVNAGHNPPLLYRHADGSVIRLQPTAPAVGLIEPFLPTTGVINLSEGDLLVLYTDGVTEAHDGGQGDYGLERLEAVVRQNADAPSADVVHAIRRDLESFMEGKPPEDDTTVLAIKIR